IALAMACAETEDKSSPGEFLGRSGFIGEQMRMAQIDVRDRSAEFDSLGVKSERERARNRVVVRLGHEDARKARVLRRPRPFDQACRPAVGKYRASKCSFGHDEFSFRLTAADTFIKQQFPSSRARQNRGIVPPSPRSVASAGLFWPSHRTDIRIANDGAAFPGSHLYLEDECDETNCCGIDRDK